MQVQAKLMHQNLAIILRQLCFSKISFVVLVPERPHKSLELQRSAEACCRPSRRRPAGLFASSASTGGRQAGSEMSRHGGQRLWSSE